MHVLGLLIVFVSKLERTQNHDRLLIYRLIITKNRAFG